MREKRKSLRKSLGYVVLLCALVISIPHAASAFEICIQDEIGERIHVNVLPNGLMTGYSEFSGTVTGTAIGSHKRISDSEVMLGGSVHNDCNSGLFPGSFNAILNLYTLSGRATGHLFLCDGTVVPFVSGISPCEDVSGSKRQNWGKIEDYQ